MKHIQNTPNQDKNVPYSSRMDKYSSIPSPYIRQLIALNTPRKRVDDVIYIYDVINGRSVRQMAAAIVFHGMIGKYPEDYVNLLLEEPEKYADRIAILEKERKRNIREQRELDREEERERKIEERLNKDFLNAKRKFTS